MLHDALTDTMGLLPSAEFRDHRLYHQALLIIYFIDSYDDLKEMGFIWQLKSDMNNEMCVERALFASVPSVKPWVDFQRNTLGTNFCSSLLSVAEIKTF